MATRPRDLPTDACGHGSRFRMRLRMPIAAVLADAAGPHVSSSARPPVPQASGHEPARASPLAEPAVADRGRSCSSICSGGTGLSWPHHVSSRCSYASSPASGGIGSQVGLAGLHGRWCSGSNRRCSWRSGSARPVGHFGGLVPLAAEVADAIADGQLIVDAGHASEASHRFRQEGPGIDSLILASKCRSVAVLAIPLCRQETPRR